MPNGVVACIIQILLASGSADPSEDTLDEAGEGGTVILGGGGAGSVEAGIGVCKTAPSVLSASE